MEALFDLDQAAKKIGIGVPTLRVELKGKPPKYDKLPGRTHACRVLTKAMIEAIIEDRRSRGLPKK